MSKKTKSKKAKAKRKTIQKNSTARSSSALLLQDARVWCGGSRKYSDPQNFEFENDMERRIEIFSPGYLDPEEGTQPIIEEAPLVINYGQGNEFTIILNIENELPEINSVVLISLASVTHCFDSNQRYIILDFTQPQSDKLQVKPPLNNYIAPPGYYMLFVLKVKSQSNSGEWRIPSVAKIVKLMESA